MNEIKKILNIKQKLGFFLLTVLMILNAFFEILSLNFIFLTISYFSIENFLLTDSVLLKFLKNLFSIKDISNFLILGLAISFSLKTKSLKQAHRSSLQVSQNLESHMCITACHIFLRHFENHQRTL